ncbi:tyrosine-type recombinase/integrase [Streptomyces olivaceiscleroticus]|uniref:Site-specific integrase n=1 Tax=Streptomyces olivaceiscleroticus TaxID=68245 RepID=A0ABN1BKN4_9ACTN
MANVQKRPNGKWRARYRDLDGKEHARHFDRKVDAQRWIDEVTASVITGQYVDPRSAKTPFREYAEKWRASQPHRPSTAKAVAQHLRCYVYPIWEKRALGAIKPGDIQTWVTSLTTNHKLAASTSRTVFNTVNAVFRAAVRDRMIPHNPCVEAKLPAVPRKKVVPLAVEQVRALAEAVPARYKSLVLLGAATGLRPGELFGLQLRHVDLLHATVSVEQQIQQTAKHRVYVGPPKTARSYRTVPLPRVAVDTMNAHLRDFPVDGPESWVFTAPQGGPVVYTHFMDGAWRPACAKVGIAKGTGPHALRHHYASLLIKHGESVKTVSERLGHTNAAMTLNIYTHLWPDSEERTRAAVDKAYADRPDQGEPQAQAVA